MNGSSSVEANVSLVVQRLSADQRRQLMAASHMDERTIRRCAQGHRVTSSSLARIVEALRKLGLYDGS